MNITQENFEQGVKAFQATREEDQLDLVTKVKESLSEAGLGNNLEKFDNDNLIVLAKDKTADVQRHFLNRYWSFQLANASCSDTFEARVSLIPDGTPWDWLKLFNENVIPVCKKYNLPN